MSSQNIHFVTFGDSQKFQKCLNVITQEATSSKLFDYVHSYNETNLNKDFLNKHLSFMKRSRGFGYWLWKPQIILQTFDKMNNGDILIYADSGCQINKEGKQRLQEYIELVNNSNYDNLSFELTYDLTNNSTCCSHLEKTWTKGDLLNFFPINKQSPQLMATAFIIKKSEFSINLVKEWLSLCEQNNYHLINDSPSSIPNEPGFIEHRHDQSLWSVLRKHKGTHIIHLDETWYPNKWDQNIDKPIHARRRRL
jgi:hypothetical protein